MFHRKPIADNRRLLVVLLCALLSIVAAPSPSAAQTAAPHCATDISLDRCHCAAL